MLFVAFAGEDSGQKWEIQCAKEECEPVGTVISGVATSAWSDPNISAFIDSL
jgi:hypothetical protein